MNVEDNSKGLIETHFDDGIGRIEFSHPSSNAFPISLLKELTNTINIAGESDEVHVIILSSKGNRAFCAGASFTELAEIDNIEKGKVFFSGFAQVINAMRKCNKIIVARIQGKAVGGGVGIAAAADYCFATTSSSIRLSELAIGIGPFVIGPALEKKMGHSPMRQMALTPDKWRSAQWAFEHNLYDEIYDSIEKMDVAIHEMVHKLNGYNPEALTALKKTFWENTENWNEHLLERAKISGKLVLSPFTKEAISQFNQN